QHRHCYRNRRSDGCSDRASLTAHRLRPKNRRRQRLRDGPYRGLFWTQALAGAVACLAFAVALGDAKPSIPTLVIVLLVIAGIARLLIPIFPTDQNGTRFQTAHGTIHM